MDANNRHTLLSKQIIYNRYKRVTGDSISPKSLKTATEHREDRSIFADPGLTSGFSTRPIVVLGDVGVGKTSFFENLSFHLDESQRNDTFILHLNLGQQGSIAIDLRVLIINEIIQKLKSDYQINIESESFAKSAHFQRLRDFDDGPNGSLRALEPVRYELRKIDHLNALIGDRAAHLQSSLAHLCHGQKKQIIIIIDNADQRSFDTQQQAFLISQELAASGSCIVFVALRPSTFYESKKRGALSGYQNKIFAISPPPADEVVQRRLQFAIRVAEGSSNWLLSIVLDLDFKE